MVTSLAAKLALDALLLFVAVALVYLGAIDFLDPQSKANMIADQAAKLPPFVRLFFSPRFYRSKFSVFSFRLGGALMMLAGIVVIVAVALSLLH